MATTPANRRGAIVEQWRERWYGPHGRFNSDWTLILNEDPVLDTVSMCIDLVFGPNIRLRVSTKPLTLKDVLRTGDPKRGYLPLLMEEPSITMDYSIGSGAASLRSFSISVSEQLLDPWDIIRKGGMLAGWAEVFLAQDGMNFEDRFVIMRGDMAGGITFGGVDEMLEVEIVDPSLTIDYSITPYVCYRKNETSTSMPDANFGDLPDEAVGQRFPLIINGYPFTECLRLDRSDYPMFMACLGTKFASTTLYIDGVVSGSLSLSASTSLDGIVFLSVQSSAAMPLDDTQTVHASLVATDDPKDAIDCIRYLVETWSLMGPAGTNDELFELAKAKFPATGYPFILINGSSTNNGAKALEYIESTLCGEFPMISMTYFGGGYGPIVTDRRSKLIRGRFVVGQYPFVDRNTAFQETSKSELYNRFVIKYKYNAMDDTWGGAIVRDPSNSSFCLLSEAMTGPRDYATMECITVHDDSTAGYIADWLVTHFAVPSYYVEYDCYGGALMALRLGDNIKILEPDIHETDYLDATVEKIEYSSGKCVVGIRLWVLYPDLGGASTTGLTIGGKEEEDEEGVGGEEKKAQEVDEYITGDWFTGW